MAVLVCARVIWETVMNGDLGFGRKQLMLGGGVKGKGREKERTGDIESS